MRISFIVVLLCLASTSAEARDQRVDQIPHGDSYGCTSCHQSASGGGAFTRFGSDCVSALVGDGHVSMQNVDWSQLAAKDSDRDGFTNGEELNDPNGEWSAGQSDPVGGRTYNPGDPNDHPLATCGDGRVTPPEECDGTNHRELSCFGLGLDDGTLVCNPDCTFDRSGCDGTPSEEPTTNGGGEMSDVEDDPMTDTDAACSVGGESVSSSTPWLVLCLCFFLAVRIGGRRLQRSSAR